MMIEMLKAKLHRAVVTEANLQYNGSISIDPALCEAVGILEYEKVDVLNITNGARLTTYVIHGTDRQICLNGAAARLAQPGDQVIICAYCSLTPREASAHTPRVALLNSGNAITEILPRP